MIRFLILSCLCILCCVFGPPSSAADSYGLAMHGAPKYKGGEPALSYADPRAPKGGQIVMDALGTFDTLNPFVIKGEAARGLNMVYDRLMTRVWDEPFTLYPLIAEQVRVAGDRSWIAFDLNPKARFHDGSPVTTADVLFSFETLRDKGRPNMRRIYKLVEAVDTPGARTVRFRFGPGYDRETVMILAMMPVLSKAWWQGRDFEATLLTPPLGNGPYRVGAVDPGRRIVLERVPDYWAADLLPNRGQYNFDRVIYDYYRDDTVAFESFKAGNIDIRREWNAGKWAAQYDFPALKTGDIVKTAFSHHRPDKVRGLIFNTRRSPFDDIRVREALIAAFDFEWVNQSLFHGLYRRTDGYFPNTELAAPQPLPVLKTQADRRAALETADRALQDAGWIVRQGQRVHKDSGKPFTFEIMTGALEDEKIALAFSRSLKRLGIEAKIRPLDAASFRGRLNVYDFDMTAYFWTSTLSPGTEQYLYWSCEAAKQESRWNYAGICDPAIDVLSRAIAGAATREDLVAQARALDTLLMKGAYMVPLYYNPYDYIAYRSWLGFAPETPLYGPVTESWWDKRLAPR